MVSLQYIPVSLVLETPAQDPALQGCQHHHGLVTHSPLTADTLCPINWTSNEDVDQDRTQSWPLEFTTSLQPDLIQPFVPAAHRTFIFMLKIKCQQ